MTLVLGALGTALGIHKLSLFLSFLKLFICGCAGSSLLQGLSLVVVSRAALGCGAQASHCLRLSCCGAQTLGHSTFSGGVRGHSSFGFWALEHRLTSCNAWV